ncbi:hypothetical protein NliqN6_1244 [Naganishia liquefaciens]|uniref:Ribonuclease n=1 Tax=Naganishia liquefaciens TaxID=104408 RepID=A0A8H3TPH2_9TREE|nr:hypothetical protein NliqN6_1244 [Naganishia liquefaciens]
MAYPADPVNPIPATPLIHGYSYHSALPESTSVSETNEEGVRVPWIMGIDEAGRGPVLGPMVYAAAYCPKSFQGELEGLGFDDSKALSIETRDRLWNVFTDYPELCYSSNIISPQSISKHMLKRVPFNLNRQAEEATISLIRDNLRRGVNLTDVFVDALGPAPAWEAKLSEIFPELTFTVRPKADSLFKVVSAASIIAKVTRDRIVENWIHPESPGLKLCLKAVAEQSTSDGKGKKTVGKALKGKGKQRAADEDTLDGKEDVESGSAQGPARKRRKLREFDSETTLVDSESPDVEASEETGEAELKVTMVEERGSGYPSDPKTQAYLKAAFDPIFGYPSIVRFSWGTVKIAMDKNGIPCTWTDDPVLTNRMKFFESPLDAGKPRLWKEIGLSSVGEL